MIGALVALRCPPTIVVVPSLSDSYRSFVPCVLVLCPLCIRVGLGSGGFLTWRKYIKSFTSGCDNLESNIRAYRSLHTAAQNLNV